MSLNVLTQGGGTGGESASIFITGLDENSTVTAKKGSKTVNGVWTQKQNPASVVPSGYTQLEYIESTGAQYIDTGVSGGTNAAYEIVLNPLSMRVTYEQYFAGAASSPIPKLFGLNSTQLQGESTNGSIFVNSPYNQIHTFTYNANGQFYHNESLLNTLGCAGNGWGSTTWWVFNSHGEPTLQSSMRLYSLKMWTNGTLIRNFIPAKRKSDGVIGLYDLVNSKFYTNAGSGTFLAGAEILSTIYGHLIAPVKSYGTWTVTATNGEETTTQDVLVDAAVEFEIEMGYFAYLYNYGDECEDLTGGWQAVALKYVDNTNAVAPTITRNDDNMAALMNAQGGGIIRCANAIDLTNVEKMYFTGVFEYGVGMDMNYLRLCIWSSLGSVAVDNVVKTIPEWKAGTDTVRTVSCDNVEIDVSTLSGNHIIGFNYYGQWGSSKGEYVRSTMYELKMR